MSITTINIVTTASLPWKTGTAILALFRALYLSQKGYKVTLYCPWLEKKDQQAKLFGKNLFCTPEEQEKYIMAVIPDELRSTFPQIQWYDATYYTKMGSILPKKNLLLTMEKCDWLILEEPEHLAWRFPFGKVNPQIKRVTGILLTNYDFYMTMECGRLPASILHCYSKWLVERNCTDVIRISSSLPSWKNATVLNVNGVNPRFFTNKVTKSTSGIYFIGKLIWQKGFRDLINLLASSDVKAMDIYGNGIHKQEICLLAQKKGITLNLKGEVDDPATALKDYKIFFNPSQSEGLCTTTAEALAQEKFVIIPKHHSNEFFYQFSNCFVYQTPEEFREKLSIALNTQPRDDDDLWRLHWDQATDRLLAYHKDSLRKEN